MAAREGSSPLPCTKFMRCSVCEEEKPGSEFSWKNAKLGNRQSKCKECTREYGRRHYASNRDVYKKNSSTNRKTYIEKARKFVMKILLNTVCVDCGESDPVVLDFDHIEPKSKKMNVSNMILSGYSTESIRKEIGKCEVRCANCHRRRTARDNDWFRLLP